MRYFSIFEMAKLLFYNFETLLSINQIIYGTATKKLPIYTFPRISITSCGHLVVSIQYTLCSSQKLCFKKYLCRNLSMCMIPIKFQCYIVNALHDQLSKYKHGVQKSRNGYKHVLLSEQNRAQPLYVTVYTSQDSQNNQFSFAQLEFAMRLLLSTSYSLYMCYYI